MKKLLMIVLLTGFVVYTGCSSEETAMDNDSSKEVTTEDVAKEADDLLETTGELTEQQIDELKTTMRQKSEEMDDKVEALEKKGAKLTGEAREEWEEQMKTLEKKRNQFVSDLETLESNTEEAWGEIVEGVRASWKELKEALQEAEAESRNDDSE